MNAHNNIENEKLEQAYKVALYRANHEFKFDLNGIITELTMENIQFKWLGETRFLFWASSIFFDPYLTQMKESIIKNYGDLQKIVDVCPDLYKLRLAKAILDDPIWFTGLRKNENDDSKIKTLNAFLLNCINNDANYDGCYIDIETDAASLKSKLHENYQLLQNILITPASAQSPLNPLYAYPKARVLSEIPKYELLELLKGKHEQDRDANTIQRIHALMREVNIEYDEGFIRHDMEDGYQLGNLLRYWPYDAKKSDLGPGRLQEVLRNVERTNTYYLGQPLPDIQDLIKDGYQLAYVLKYYPKTMGYDYPAADLALHLIKNFSRGTYSIKNIIKDEKQLKAVVEQCQKKDISGLGNDISDRYYANGGDKTSAFFQAAPLVSKTVPEEKSNTNSNRIQIG